VLGAVLVLGAFALAAGRFLVVTDALPHADAIVVLGGDAPHRARHAVDLFNQGYAPLVVFSGGTLQDVGLACSSSLLSLEAARELGLPGDAVLIAAEAQTTYDEAVNLRCLAQERGWRSLIVVTSPLHTRRAARTFRTLLPGVAVYVSAAPDPRYDPARWWETEDGLVAVFNETIKLAFYWARYGIAPF
jgi:uncharacterized SAM-binding protein YcdF (DUF218 family)